MSSYVLSLQNYQDQRFGTQVASLDPGYTYAVHPSHSNVAHFFDVSGSTVSLAARVYFDYETESLRKVNEDGTSSSLDVSDWGVAIQVNETNDWFELLPAFSDFDESYAYTDLSPNEHDANAAIADMDPTSLGDVAQWGFKNPSLGSYFEFESGRLRLKDGWHFDYISSDSLDLKKNTVSSDGTVSWNTVSDLGPIAVIGYGSSDDPVGIVDLTVSVSDIAEGWSVDGVGFSEYAYGVEFASLSGSALSGGSTFITNQLFDVADDSISFSDTVRLATAENVSESDRIEDYQHSGINITTGDEAVAHLYYLEDGEAHPSYTQKLSNDQIRSLMDSSVPLARSGVEDNPVLSTLVSNQWFLDTEVTYRFAAAGETPSSSDEYTVSSTTTAWSQEQRATMTDAMDLISSVCGVTFSEVSDGEAADKNFQLVQSITTYAGYSGYPYDDTFVVDIDDFGLDVLVHELCHTLGIAHPFESGHGTTALDGVLSDSHPGTNQLNTSYWTVMSYGNVRPDVIPVSITSPPMSTFDIAALQALYGENQTTAPSDSSYSSPQSMTAIWDADGNDLIDFSAATEACVIDLRDAPLDGSADSGGYLSYSQTGEFAGGYLIAQGSAIERASSGSGDDVIVGNDLDNILASGSGSDTLTAGRGADQVNAGDGDDSIYLTSDRSWGGGIGAHNVGYGSQVGTGEWVEIAGKARFDDVCLGGGGDDRIFLTELADAFFLHDALSRLIAGVSTEADYTGQSTTARMVNVESISGGQGDDLIDLTSPDFSLDGLTVTLDGGTGDDVLWAGDGDDIIDGGAGDDVLSGGAGDDEMTGGSGSDRFDFTQSAGSDRITDFDPAVDSIRLLGTDTDPSTWTWDGTLIHWGVATIELDNLSALNEADLSGAVSFTII